jgi:hypothetical protein
VRRRGQQVSTPGQVPLVPQQRGQGLAHLAQFAHLFRHRPALRAQSSITIKQPQVLPRSQQRQVFALAVDIHQSLADLAQQAHGHHPSVNAGDGTATGPDLAGQDQYLVILPFQAVTLDQRFERRLHGGLQQKQPFHLSAIDASAHLIRTDAPAQQRADGVNDDRLAGACLASENVETRHKTEV